MSGSKSSLSTRLQIRLDSQRQQARPFKQGIVTSTPLPQSGQGAAWTASFSLFPPSPPSHSLLPPLIIGRYRKEACRQPASTNANDSEVHTIYQHFKHHKRKGHQPPTATAAGMAGAETVVAVALCNSSG